MQLSEIQNLLATKNIHLTEEQISQVLTENGDTASTLNEQVILSSVYISKFRRAAKGELATPATGGLASTKISPASPIAPSEGLTEREKPLPEGQYETLQINAKGALRELALEAAQELDFVADLKFKIQARKAARLLEMVGMPIDGTPAELVNRLQSYVDRSEERLEEARKQRAAFQEEILALIP